MPRVSFVEKTIFEIEGVKVDFIKDGRNVRDEVMLPSNYSANKMTKNNATAAYLINKLQRDYPGYDFVVYNYNGTKARGNTLLSTIRDTYLVDED